MHGSQICIDNLIEDVQLKIVQLRDYLDLGKDLGKFHKDLEAIRGDVAVYNAYKNRMLKYLDEKKEDKV